jgi:hypothetical protein
MPNKPELNEPDPKKPDIDDLEWLVECRSKNQRLAFKLYKILRTKSLSKNDPRLMTAAGFLVSTIFSLWRAVFICPSRHDPDQTLAKAEMFLDKLIEDNAINYSTEKAHKEWTFSYFLNNAALRLQALSGESFKYIVDPELFSWDKLLPVWGDRKEAWRLCHDTAEVAVHKLDTLLSKPTDRGTQLT